MPLELSQRTPVMAITQDGLPLSHLEQTRLLLEAGVTWIQLRMKQVSDEEVLSVAVPFVEACRKAGAVSIINDRVEVALESNAHGVHLGATDMEWREARVRLGGTRFLGGTVNSLDDATRAKASGTLDYVGAGPWRFTHNKKNLAPVLGPEGLAPIIAALAPLPVWVIGGIQSSDMPEARRLGAAGVAVSSALFAGTSVGTNTQLFFRSWENADAPLFL